MATSGYKKLRVSDFSLQGETEEITSDVKLPNSRIQSKGDAGTESSSGSLSTEWFIDEVDDFLKASMLSTQDSFPVTLGSEQTYFTFIKEYYQGANKAYEVFTGVQVGQASITFELKSKVKLTFNLNGDNNPDILTSGADFTRVKNFCETATGWETKSYNTLKGMVGIEATNGEFTGDFSALVRSLSYGVNQNLDSTSALFQKKAIDNSLGDETIDGTIEVWNTQDNKTVGLRNSAKKWVDDVKLTVTMSENEEDTDGDTKYTVELTVSLKTPTESKDGNKLAFSIPFQVYNADGLTVSKEVVTD